MELTLGQGRDHARGGAVVIEDEDDTYVRVGLDTYQVLCYTGEADRVTRALATTGAGRVVGECAIVDD